MEISRIVGGKRVDICRLPKGDEPGFAYSPIYKPGEAVAQRIREAKEVLIRERVGELGLDLNEKQIHSWSLAYEQTVVVIGGSGKAAGEGHGKRQKGAEASDRPDRLEVWGYELLRRLDGGDTKASTLPVSEEADRKGVVDRLRKLWPNAEALPESCAHGSAEAEERIAGLLREGKLAVVFR